MNRMDARNAHDASMHLRPVPKDHMGNLRRSDVATRLSALVEAVSLGLLVAAGSSLLLTVVIAPFNGTQDSSIDIGWIVLWTFLSSFVAASVTTYPAMTTRALVRRDTTFLESTSRRVSTLLNRTSLIRENGSETRVRIVREGESDRFVSSILSRPDSWPGGRALIVDLERLIRLHEETEASLGHDEGRVEEARRMTKRAIHDIALSHRRRYDEETSESVMRRLSDGCRDAVDAARNGIVVTTTAPSARIARIISTAEAMLSVDPDLVDSNGSRVDDLVRIHVPRLLAVHSRAASVSSSDQIPAVDLRLDEAVEKIRISVEEAARSVHHEAMDALATEIRFLSLRRRELPLQR